MLNRMISLPSTKYVKDGAPGGDIGACLTQVNAQHRGFNLGHQANRPAAVPWARAAR